MSRKTKKHTARTDNQNMPESQGVDIGSTAKGSVNSAIETANNNKLMLGSLLGAAGAAYFLLATDSGKRVRCGIQDRAMNLYDQVSDQVVDGIDRVRGLVGDMMSKTSSEVEKASERSLRIA